MYSNLCHIEADTSALSARLKAQPRRRNRQPYYEMEYDIVLSFGLTELKAQFCWKENVGCVLYDEKLVLIVDDWHRGRREGMVDLSHIKQVVLRMKP